MCKTHTLLCAGCGDSGEKSEQQTSAPTCAVDVLASAGLPDAALPLSSCISPLDRWRLTVVFVACYSTFYTAESCCFSFFPPCELEKWMRLNRAWHSGQTSTMTKRKRAGGRWGEGRAGSQGASAAQRHLLFTCFVLLAEGRAGLSLACLV